MTTRLAALALILGLLAACSTSVRPNCPASVQDQTAATGYRLGPHDEVQVTVFRQPDLSGRFALDGEGDLALPLVGVIPAGGLTMRRLEDAIEARLVEENLLVNPQVSVQLLTYRPFYILGEVARPGAYEYRDGMTVINAVALAGGYSYRAKTTAVTIERGNCHMATEPDTVVLPGDIITVPERFF